MLNYIPVLGWLLSLLFSIAIAIPFCILWNWLAPVYFYWLPKVYLDLPFLHTIGLFMLMPMIKILIYPRGATSFSSSDSKKK